MKLLAALSSVKLFIVIAAVAAVLAVSATVIPQGEEAGYYGQRFGPIVGGLIVAIGLDEFFSSRLLFILAVAAELNLALCTLPRLVRRVRTDHRRADRRIVRLAARYAADVIHLGLLLVIAAALVSIAAADRREVLVRTGETITFRGRSFTVVDSREVTGATGEFEDVVLGWDIDLAAALVGEAATERLTIGTNRPARYGSLRVYFLHWSREPQIDLRGDDGSIYPMLPGEGFALADGRALVFDGLSGRSGTDPAGLAFSLIGPEGRVEQSIEYPIGATLGPYVISAVESVPLVGFRLVYNPARPPAIIAMVFVVIGMLLYGVKVSRRHAARS